MLDTDDLALWHALNRLMTNYWADVDHNGGSQAHEFYLPEALYTVGNNRFEGAEKIRAFYARRRRPAAICPAVGWHLAAWGARSQPFGAMCASLGWGWMGRASLKSCEAWTW
jgi:hypothetical protein